MNAEEAIAVAIDYSYNRVRAPCVHCGTLHHHARDGNRFKCYHASHGMYYGSNGHCVRTSYHGTQYILTCKGVVDQFKNPHPQDVQEEFAESIRKITAILIEAYSRVRIPPYSWVGWEPLQKYLEWGEACRSGDLLAGYLPKELTGMVLSYTAHIEVPECFLETLEGK